MRISDWSSDVCSSDLEIYTALERGTFQAASLPFSYAHATYKLHEVSKWYTYGMAPGTVNCPLVVSRSAFDKLPADYRSLLVDAKADAYATMIAAYKAADDRNIPMFDEAGLAQLGRASCRGRGGTSV